jgi:thymidylate kinase
MTEQQEISQFVTTVFRAWHQAQINFLILRNYEMLPHFTTNDIDVLVAPTQVGRAERTLLAAARDAGFRLHNRAEFATLALYFSGCNSNAQAHFDLFTALKWRGLDFLEAQDFLGRKVERGSFAVPHPADEASTNLLATMIYTAKVKEKYKTSIASGFRDYPALTRDLLARTYGAQHAGAIVSAGAKEQWAEIEASTPALRKALVVRQLVCKPWRTAKSLLTDAKRLVKRWLRPPGMSVVLCGADGSGKSRAAELLVESLSGTFSPVKGRHFHWKPPVFTGSRQAARGDATEPHKKPARNPVASLVYFGVHWLEFFLGAFLRIRPVTFRGGLVLIDRYYYDFFVDQRRFRLQVPRAIVRLGYSLLPKPDLVVLLDAPAAVLQGRKQEVGIEETERQCQAYRQLFQGLGNGCIIDATQTPEKVAADLTRAVLDSKAKKLRTKSC